MANQATMRSGATSEPQSTSGNGKASGNGGTVVGSLSELGTNIATLVELQAKLAAFDAREAASSATIPLAVAAAGVVVILGSVPVVLLGLSDVLARSVGIAPGWMMLLTGLVALAVAGVIVVISVREITKSMAPLRRSHEELTRNLAWMKTVLVYSGHIYPKRGV